MNSETGKWIILLGGIIVLIGVVILFFHDRLQWLGRLPGDIRIDKPNFRFYFPIVTMLVISIVFTLLVNIIRRFLH